VIFCRWFQPLILVMAGAISCFGELAPAREGALPASETTAAGEDDRPATGLRLLWKAQPDRPEKAAVEVVGADPAALRLLARTKLTVEHWNTFFFVRVIPAAEAKASDQPPLWGSYKLTGDVIRFEPRFPLEPGMRYRAEFDPARLEALATTVAEEGYRSANPGRSTTRLSADYSPRKKKPAEATTQVAAIFPSRDLLPENLLRFYIVFSAPMSRGEAYDRITLVNEATGKKVDAPFLELGEELWSPDGVRFTLLFDPGRIKRGLKPREEMGPVLQAGNAYSLVIDRHWLDASGNPLKAEFRKTFRVGPPDETSPDPKKWSMDAPRAGTRDPLVVRFPESLDRALLDRLIWVESTEAKVVAGQISLETAETTWRFTPASPWREGAHRLVVGTELEDLAGNSVARPFEVDVAGPISHRVTGKTVERPFEIGVRPH
jgi:hypothetical protein